MPKNCQLVGMKIGHNVLTQLYRVKLADLPKPDLIHKIYLSLFKHMMKWVERFRKKINSSRHSMMPGKILCLIPDSVYRKEPIMKSHNSSERKCASSVDAIPQN